MEHIAAAEDFIRGMVVERVMVAPGAPGRDVTRIDAGILTGVPDRATKVQAPDRLKPANRFATRFHRPLRREPRQDGGNFSKTLLDSATTPSTAPQEQNGDAYEFILLIGSSSERHTKQELKAEPNFPKS
jgi:hypothetical protein